jgi:hypothetical protein
MICPQPRLHPITRSEPCLNLYMTRKFVIPGDRVSSLVLQQRRIVIISQVYKNNMPPCSCSRVLHQWSHVFSFLHSLPSMPNSAKSVAIIGTGPAGLFAAWALQNDGYQVTIFEKAREHRYFSRKSRLADKDIAARPSYLS